MNLPFSQACENNKQPILEVIEPLFEKRDSVVEIGSGTGQHAEFFAASMPSHPMAANRQGRFLWQ